MSKVGTNPSPGLFLPTGAFPTGKIPEVVLLGHRDDQGKLSRERKQTPAGGLEGVQAQETELTKQKEGQGSDLRNRAEAAVGRTVSRIARPQPGSIRSSLTNRAGKGDGDKQLIPDLCCQPNAVALRSEPGNGNSSGQMKLSLQATCWEWTCAFQNTICDSPHPRYLRMWPYLETASLQKACLRLDPACPTCQE